MILNEAVSVHLSLKRRLQQLGSETEGGDAICASQQRFAAALVAVGSAIAHKVFLTFLAI